MPRLSQKEVSDDIQGLRELLCTMRRHPAYPSYFLRYLAERGFCLEARLVKHEDHGPPGQCLESSKRNIEKHPEWSLWLGFDLGQDNCWYAHAWNMTPKGFIVENAMKHRLYYGIDVPGSEAWRFKRFLRTGKLSPVDR